MAGHFNEWRTLATQDRPTYMDEYIDLYAQGKRQIERYLSETPDFPSVVLRVPATLGPEDPSLRFWWYLQRIQDGREIIMRNGGSNVFRIGFRDDVAQAFIDAMDSPNTANQTYNICQDEILTMRRFLEVIAEQAGRPLNTVSIPGEAAEMFSDLPWNEVIFDHYSRPPVYVMSIAKARRDFSLRNTPFHGLGPRNGGVVRRPVRRRRLRFLRPPRRRGGPRPVVVRPVRAIHRRGRQVAVGHAESRTTIPFRGRLQMAQHKIVYAVGSEPQTDLIMQELAGLDYELNVEICTSPGETIEAAKGADVVITGVPITSEVIDGMEGVTAVFVPGHGYNSVDVQAATAKGIMVGNVAGGSTEEVSNHAILMLLACAKRLTVHHDNVRAGRWYGDEFGGIPHMPTIDGEVLGLVSFGNIARATARKARAFGMTVIAYDPFVPPWVPKEYSVELVAELNGLASRSDFVSVHTPLIPETEKLIGEPFFKAMKPSANFINTARGEVVDEQALIRALQNGEIAGAGIDVFEQEPTSPDNPLLKMENVIVTPHFAAASAKSHPVFQTRLGQEIARILKGTWPMSLINPEVRAKIPMRPPAINV